MATLATLRADLLTLAGQKLTPAQADALLNEGNSELCVRSEWTRANLSLGPLVDGQAAYTLPATVNRVLKVKINGKPLLPADEETVDQIKADDLRLASGAHGLYWLSFNASGVESVSVYPTPGLTDVGLSLIANCVVYPAVMDDDNDPPAVPTDFHRAVRDYAAAKAYGFREDNIELRAFHDQEFENAVERLRRLRFARVGRGHTRMRIEGVTA
jgi:hypothetical protein